MRPLLNVTLEGIVLITCLHSGHAQELNSHAQELNSHARTEIICPSSNRVFQYIVLESISPREKKTQLQKRGIFPALAMNLEVVRILRVYS